MQEVERSRSYKQIDQDQCPQGSFLTHGCPNPALCSMLWERQGHEQRRGKVPKRPNCHSNPVTQHCRATLCRITFSRIWRGVAGQSRYNPSKGPAAPTFSALKADVALQVASWKVSQGSVRSYSVTCRTTVGHLGGFPEVR